MANAGFVAAVAVEVLDALLESLMGGRFADNGARAVETLGSPVSDRKTDSTA
jgi:hypothetical protein